MKKRNTPKPAPATTVVASGDGWRIEYDRYTRDYAAWIDWDVIAFCATQTAAQVAIDTYRREELARAA